jgi:hypothetical protein
MHGEQVALVGVGEGAQQFGHVGVSVPETLHSLFDLLILVE